MTSAQKKALYEIELEYGENSSNFTLAIQAFTGADMSRYQLWKDSSEGHDALKQYNSANNSKSNVTSYTPVGGNRPLYTTTTEQIGNELPFEMISLISGNKVLIHGKVTDISHDWSSDWSESKVYGRIDPIPTYGGTQRNLSFSIEIISPAAVQEGGLGEYIRKGEHMYDAINKIANMCYPSYDFSFDDNKSYNTGIIKSAPMIAIRYGNLICGNLNIKTVHTGYLRAYMKNFKFSFKAESLFDLGVSTGFTNGAGGRTGEDMVVAYYRRAQLDFTFGVLHDHNVGFDGEGVPLVNRDNGEGDGIFADSKSYPLKLNTGDE